MITPSWLSELLRSVLYSFSVYFCHPSLYLLLLLGPYHFCPLLCPYLHEKMHAHLCIFPLVSLIFSKRCLVFHILVFSSISLHWSMTKAFLSVHAILWISAYKWVYLSFSLSLAYLTFSAICKASSNSHFAFMHFFIENDVNQYLLYNVTNFYP